MTLARKLSSPEVKEIFSQKANLKCELLLDDGTTWVRKSACGFSIPRLECQFRWLENYSQYQEIPKILQYKDFRSTENRAILDLKYYADFTPLLSLCQHPSKDGEALTIFKKVLTFLREMVHQPMDSSPSTDDFNRN